MKKETLSYLAKLDSSLEVSLFLVIVCKEIISSLLYIGHV